MKTLAEVLLNEAYEPEKYGGAAQSKGFYILADHEEGIGAGGKLDIAINGTKVIIKETSKPKRGNHRMYLCFEKAGKYDLEFQADCDIDIDFAGQCKVGNLTVKTTGKPFSSIYLSLKKCDTFDLSEANTGRVDLDNLTAIKTFLGPKANVCGFRIAKCNNLTTVDLSGIQNTPNDATGRLYIRNCKKLTTIDFPQAISMPLHLEKLPSLDPAVATAAEKLCKKCNVQYIDMI